MGVERIRCSPGRRWTLREVNEPPEEIEPVDWLRVKT